MRVGNNPLRLSRAPAAFEDVILTVITHLPNLEGYHAQRLEVVKTCLNSMRDHAGARVSIVVWDNGSCGLLRDWLREEYQPDQLILSKNIGKTAARSSLSAMFPMNSIIGFSDDDMYFYPDWLRPQLEILKVFPNVASVSGYPVRTSFRWGCENTIDWARKNARLEVGRILPYQWEEDFAVSIGRDVKEHFKTSVEDVDYLAHWNDVAAFCTSHHCQFLSPAKIVSRIKQYDPLAMAPERVFDEALDKMGLRLSTRQRMTRHMGNVIHDELRKEIAACSNISAMKVSSAAFQPAI